VTEIYIRKNHKLL